MAVPGNCLLAALCAKACAPRRVRVVTMRNRAGRVHFMWERDGELFEFYTPGASRCSYLRNALRMGEIRRVRTGSKGGA